MKIIEVTPKRFKEVFDKVYPKLKHKEFVGYRTNFEDCHCYLVEDKKAGFAISVEGELVNLFNAEKYYRILDDSTVVDFIKKNADWLACICTTIYDDKYLNNIWKFGKSIRKLVPYYENKLGFYEVTHTSQDVGDMIYAKGFKYTMHFMKKYGVPYHTFLINFNGDHNSWQGEWDMGSDAYIKAKAEVIRFVAKRKKK